MLTIEDKQRIDQEPYPIFNLNAQTIANPNVTAVLDYVRETQKPVYVLVSSEIPFPADLLRSLKIFPEGIRFYDGETDSISFGDTEVDLAPEDYPERTSSDIGEKI